LHHVSLKYKLYSEYIYVEVFKILINHTYTRWIN